jgi:hypothetical protein
MKLKISTSICGWLLTAYMPCSSSIDMFPKVTSAAAFFLLAVTSALEHRFDKVRTLAWRFDQTVDHNMSAQDRHRQAPLRAVFAE